SIKILMPDGGLPADVEVVEPQPRDLRGGQPGIDPFGGPSLQAAVPLDAAGPEVGTAHRDDPRQLDQLAQLARGEDDPALGRQPPPGGLDDVIALACGVTPGERPGLGARDVLA